MWDVPSSWSLKDAATVPVAYMTAYYALLIRGALQKHHTVLVHSGTGAVGMAAIRICHHRGCEVRITCCNRVVLLHYGAFKITLESQCHAKRSLFHGISQSALARGLAQAKCW